MISLGCAKNTVDSASMAQILAGSGYLSIDQPSQARLIIVNTCGFIGPAKDKSYEVLQELAANKRDGQLLIAAGCLTQRYGAEVVRRVPGIDGVLGTRRWMDILEVVESLRHGKHLKPLYHLPDVATVGKDEHGVLRAGVQGKSAFIKIADGCRRPCAFCAIPLIKGTAVSRPEAVIIEECPPVKRHGDT